MKKWCAMLLAAMLLLALAVPAMSAPAKAEGYTEHVLVGASYGDLNAETNTFAYSVSGSRYYQLVDANGAVLVPESAGYVTMTSRTGYKCYKVEVESTDGVHDEGIIDGYDGHVVVPAKYADIIMISDRWFGGVTLVPSSAEDKDYTFTNYSSDEKQYFRIDHTDFYFDGTFVGSLTRNEFGGGYPSALGAYIKLKDIEGHEAFYDSHLVKATVEDDWLTEFMEDYDDNGLYHIHMPSGQRAFEPGCTLSADDVSNPYLYQDQKIYDLQGNVVGSTDKDLGYSLRFENGYARVRYNSKYGVIDPQGNEVVPPVYDDVSYNGVVYGHVGVVKDGKFGYVDLNGNVTCDFTYVADAVKDKGAFGVIQNLDGGYTVLTAGAGELSERFAEVDAGYGSNYTFIAKNAEGKTAIIDMYGNVLLPYTAEYKYIYVSFDGTLAAVKPEKGDMKLLHFDIDPNSAAAPAQEAPAQPEQAQPGADSAASAAQSVISGLLSGMKGEAPAAAPAADAEGWTCENGHAGNTGNFCTECGASKPEPAKPAVCPNCGASLEGIEAKFCPNCGQALN